MKTKQSKRPPSMPDWVSKVICSKYKKKGHLAFNCPPKYDNKCIRSKSRPKIQSTNNQSVAYTFTEFVGAATHFVPNNQHQNHISFYSHQHKIPGSHHKSPKIQNRTRYSYSQIKRKFSSIPDTHTLDFHEYDFHTSPLLKLCNSLPQREASIKFQRILGYFHKYELMDSIYYKRVKNYILKHIRKMNKRDLIFMI